MTDRIKGLYVVLEHDMRDDDVESLVEAIKHMRSVQSVTTDLADQDDYNARERVRLELGAKLLDVVFPDRAERRKRKS